MTGDPEYAGRTVEDAVVRALAAMNATREQVDVEVIQEPRPALLGLGGREARVRVTPRPTPGAFARDQAVQILGLMGYEAAATALESDQAISVVLTGRDMGALIGHHGRTLDALELLLGLHTARRHGRWIPVIVDAQDYRARREKALTAAARGAADRAVRDGEPVALEPMDARDRRTVHLALQDDPRVTTASEGQDEQRRVVVRPKEPAAGDE
jgi:spoIIIJ-associated protein